MGSLKAHYTDTGKGVPIVLLHSNASSGTQWRGVGAELVDRFRLIIPDLLGFGETSRWSGPQELSQDHQAEFVAALIKKSGGGPVHLAGHCYGGATAIRLASRRPDLVSSLTVIEPMLNPLLAQVGEYDLFEFWRSFWINFIDLVSAGEEAAAWKSFIDLRGGAGRWDGLNERSQGRALSMTPGVVDAFKCNLANPTTLSDCQEISIPTLVICSERATPPERRVTEILRDEIPGSRYVIIPESGHMVHCTHPSAVAQLIANHVIENTPENRPQPAAGYSGVDVR